MKSMKIRDLAFIGAFLEGNRAASTFLSLVSSKIGFAIIGMAILTVPAAFILHLFDDDSVGGKPELLSEEYSEIVLSVEDKALLDKSTLEYQAELELVEGNIKDLYARSNDLTWKYECKMRLIRLNSMTVEEAFGAKSKVCK